MDLIKAAAEMTTNIEVLTAHGTEGLQRIRDLDTTVATLNAKLDTKRQKKRDYKAQTQKYQNLWKSVRRALHGCRQPQKHSLQRRAVYRPATQF